MEPAVRHLRFQITHTTGGVEQSHYLDLARCLSLVNRRLYQQGREYFVKKVTVTDRDNQNGLISIGAAGSSWPVHQGWKMAKKMWDEMRSGHGGAPGSGLPTSITPAKWSDFKVWLSDDHRSAGSGAELLPVDNGNNVVDITNSEWNHATYYSPDGTTGADEFEVHLLGAHNGAAGSRVSVGVVQAYEDARRTVQVDDSGDQVDTDSPWINLFDDGTTLDEIAAGMITEGDFPPYALERYPGAGNNLPKPLVMGLAAIVPNYGPAGKTSTVVLGGFSAPCGLLEIETQSSESANTMDVIIELAAGDYKGIKAPSME